MAVFPMRPDLTDEKSIKEYIRYMVENSERVIAELQKDIREIKERINNA